MLAKLKFGSALTALILFLFPWIEIQCSERTMATQTGIQLIYGGGTAADGMEAGGGGLAGGSSQGRSRSKDSMGAAPLVAGVLIVVIAAFGFACMALFKGDDIADRLASVLSAVGLGLLLLQLSIGFPAKKELSDAISRESLVSAGKGDGFDDLAAPLTGAMMMNVTIRTTPVLYLELAALALPTLILLNAFIDKHRKSAASSPCPSQTTNRP